MDGDSLIADSTTLSSVTILNLGTLNMSDLSGIEYFTTLDELNCYSNQLTVLPSLPASLRYLYCYSNKLSALPVLPARLEYLACGNNLLSRLPSLPGSVREIDCQHNRIDSLPVLTDSLRSLLCGDNLLSGLPLLPQKLSYLNCYLNNISVLPALPASLKYLLCGLNGMDHLPASLPVDLLELNCNYNYISALPPLPSTLETLSFIYNDVNAIPSIPSGLMILNCNNNKLDFSDIVPVISVPAIQYAPQDSIGILETDSLNAGDNFYVDATAGYNSFNSYQWYKNNLALSSDSRISASSDSLVISFVQPSDSGSYYCSITNSQAPDLTLYLRKTYLSVANTVVTAFPFGIASGISVYPNPASDLIYINNKSSEIINAELRDLQGKMLWTGALNSASVNILDAGEFEKGIYFLFVMNEKGKFCRKLVLE